jgi:hypothetical protein
MDLVEEASPFLRSQGVVNSCHTFNANPESVGQSLSRGKAPARPRRDLRASFSTCDFRRPGDSREIFPEPSALSRSGYLD